jgi:putative phosphoesterase
VGRFDAGSLGCDPGGEGVRIAALYDVHGNLPALDAVLAEVDRERVDLLVFGGDVAAGPFPRETIERLVELPGARFVRGNADRVMVEIFDGEREVEGGLIDEWAVGQLERRHRDFLASFEPTVSAGGALFCHATPHDDEPIFTRVSPDERVRALLGEVDERLVVCGHTHMQFDRTVEGIRVVNAGSVGLPYGTTEACWAIVEDGDVELRRTAYDREALRRSGFAKVGDFLEEHSEEEAIEFFEAQAASTG